MTYTLTFTLTLTLTLTSMLPMICTLNFTYGPLSDPGFMGFQQE